MIHSFVRAGRGAFCRAAPLAPSLLRLRAIGAAALACTILFACGDGTEPSSADIPLPGDPRPGNYAAWRDAWDGQRWIVGLKKRDVTEDVFRSAFARSLARALEGRGAEFLSDLGLNGVVGRFARAPLLELNQVPAPTSLGGRAMPCDAKACPSFAFVILTSERAPWRDLAPLASLERLGLQHLKADGAVSAIFDAFSGMEQVWFAEPDLEAPSADLSRSSAARPKGAPEGPHAGAPNVTPSAAPTTAASASSARAAGADGTFAMAEGGATQGEPTPALRRIRILEAEALVKERKASNSRFVELETPVAILDTGIDNAHPSLKGRLWGQSPGGDSPAVFKLGNAQYFGDKYGIDASWEAADVDNVNQFSPGSADVGGPGTQCATDETGNIAQPEGTGCSHGTHVAGIVAAAPTLRESTEMRGVCSFCKLIAVRVATVFKGNPKANGKIRDSAQIRGMQYIQSLRAKENRLVVNVVNMSIGQYTSSRAMRTVIDALDRSGVLLVAAAANQNTDRRSYPGAYDNVISVCATSEGGDLDRGQGRGPSAKATFSNFGEWVDICAPGEAILSIVPGGELAKKDGTSMAAPLVAGAGAFLMGLANSLGIPEVGRARTIRSWLEDNSNWEYLYLNGSNQAYQWGLPDKKTGVEFLGRGLLDVENALSKKRPVFRNTPPGDQIEGGCVVGSIGAPGGAGAAIGGALGSVPGVLGVALILLRYLGRGGWSRR